MRPLPRKCENSNEVASFCGCISGESEVDAAAEAFCRRAAEGTGTATGDELVELKKALKDLETTDPVEDDSCCEC